MFTVLPLSVRRLDWRLLIVAAWALFVLLPVLKTGWLSDDVLNASLPGRWIYCHSSMTQDAVLEIKGWTFGTGRINPLIHILKNVSFAICTNMWWYKVGLIAGVLVNLVVWRRLLRRLGASRDLASLCCLMAVTLFQFRIIYDPILSFNGLMQWLFLATALSLDFFHRYLTRGGVVWLLLSLLCYSLAALTYEMVYVFWVLHLAILVTTRGGWARLSVILPYVAIPTLLTIATLWLRSRPECGPGEYAGGLSIPIVACTFLKQVVAAVPCSYAALAPAPQLRGVFNIKTMTANPTALVCGFLAFLPFMVRLAGRGPVGRAPFARLALLGFLLALAPALLLALARKYQDYLLFGIGYLPVYIQCYGMALLLVCAVGLLLRPIRSVAATRALAVLATVVCAVIASFHTASNADVTAAVREPYLSPRREIEDVLDRGGLLADIPNGAVVVADPNCWDFYEGSHYFYCFHTHTCVKDVVLKYGAAPAQLAALPNLPAGSATGPPLVRVRYVTPEKAQGYAIAGTLLYARPDANGAVAETGIRQVRLAVRRGGGANSWERAFTLHAAYVERFGEKVVQNPVTLVSSALRRSAETRYWTVYDVDLPCPSIEGETLWLEFRP